MAYAQTLSKSTCYGFSGRGKTTKERYQIEQAKIAIGSGGFTGKGFLQGTQNKLRFMPAGQTDFIFAVLCEEAGLIGAFIILILYAILFLRLFSIVQSNKTVRPTSSLPQGLLYLSCYRHSLTFAWY